MEIEEIILKESIQELSLEERLELSSWLNEDSKHLKIYNQVKLIMARRGNTFGHTGEDEVWSSLMTRIDFKKNDKPVRKSSYLMNSYLKYAAIILLSIGLGSLIHQYLPEDQEVGMIENRVIEKVSMPGQKITTRLPDGTEVKLNTNSRLLVPERFSEESRRVELTGEAFFEVVPDKSRPFIISVGNMEVEVLGTSFNVKEDDILDQKIVAVKTGKVTVKDKESGELVVLNPSQLVMQNRGEGLYKKDFTLNDKIFGWTENKLVFNDDNYQVVLRELERWFGYEVEMIGKIDREVKCTATYINPTLEEVLLSTSHIFKFQYQINGKHIKIK
ncbi:unnamed protein product [Chrysoparadoxa australica]